MYYQTQFQGPKVTVPIVTLAPQADVSNTLLLLIVQVGN
jgi:hypothetical protein